MSNQITAMMKARDQETARAKKIKIRKHLNADALLVTIRAGFEKMKVNSLKSIVTGIIMALAISPVYAGVLKAVGWDSQSGCAKGFTETSVETGTLEFRTAVDMTLGMVEALRASCPDVHLIITEPNPSCVPPNCGGSGG